MNLVHDTIKIRYIREGYLPNHPYHLISDAEMCDAFIDDTTDNFFFDYYPCTDNSLQSQHTELVTAIQHHIAVLKQSSSAEYQLPYWVYSYMLGIVVGPYSTPRDIHDLLVLMNMDNLYDIFTPEASIKCNEISTKWLLKLSTSDADYRPATIFGEPHVIKSLRLQYSERK